MNDLEFIIKAQLFQIKGVVACGVQINYCHKFDHERQLPAYSMRVIVQGGKKKKIAKVVLQNKPIGMATVGNTRVEIKDAFELSYLINIEVVKDG